MLGAFPASTIVSITDRTAATSTSAGEACDFAYGEHGSGWFNLILVGSKIEVQSGGRVTFVHENLSTGYVLTETVSYTVVFFFEKDRIVEAGLTWHVRDADGNLVLVEGGLVVYDLDLNVVKYTPNRTPDVWAVMCPALGGSPA